MKALLCSLLIVVGVESLAGCSGTDSGGVVPIGPDMYMIGGLGALTDFSSSAVKARLYGEASKFCVEKGRTIYPVSSTGKDSGPATYASAEVQFLCLNPGDARLHQ
jgi:hypothetical protein